ncbi:BRCT domain-containing protein [Mycena albidolilacea]|uniref:BRCT domain-containing protein n=1 Tax=Mycena albidolilacea TaxID=1033008 RepID=A0AAD7A6U5_9AGAR|nr:BRCT domain-containing protein [Mycena albidolilacea]
MPDVVNYQNEMRNRGKKGTRRVSGRGDEEESENPDVEKPSKKRRKVEDGKRGRVASTSDDESVVERLAKPKARKSELALRDGKPIKIMTTGLPPGSELSDDVLKALAKLGVRVTNRAAECTHLIVHHLVRTEKFLCALAGAPYIVTKEWAEDCATNGQIMPEDDYLLEDGAAEAKYDFKLVKAVKRAKTLKGKLFRDQAFYLTAHVKQMEILRNVILANGGQIITAQPSLRTLQNDPHRHVISCEEDAAIWQPLAVAHHPVYTSELVLTCALRQEIDWIAFRVPGSKV